MTKEELKIVTNEELIDKLNYCGYDSYYEEYRADIVAEIKKRMRERCSDAISRTEAIRLAEQGQVQGFEWQIKKLITSPSVMPIHKKGKWINGNPICPCCGEDKFKDLDADIWSDWQPKYCPNCGADMESEK
jgi:hypothetical protein